MTNNTKLLIIFSFLIIIGGVIFVLIGLQDSRFVKAPIPSPSITESTEVVQGIDSNLILVTKWKKDSSKL